MNAALRSAYKFCMNAVFQLIPLSLSLSPFLTVTVYVHFFFAKCESVWVAYS